MRSPQSEVTSAQKAPDAAKAQASRGRRATSPQGGPAPLQRRYGNRGMRGVVQAKLNSRPVDEARGATEPSERHVPETVRHDHGGPGAAAKGAAVFAGRGGYGSGGEHVGADSGTAARAGGQGAAARFSGGGTARFTTTDARPRPWYRRLGTRTEADAAPDTVRFESDHVTFSVPDGGLQTYTDPTTGMFSLGVSGWRSKLGGFQGSATVTAWGPADRVGAYDVGFLQTVFKSARKFYYKPTDPGSRARFKLNEDVVPGLPVRDGDGSQPGPWTNSGRKAGWAPATRFDAENGSQKITATIDAPRASAAWTVGFGSDQQELVGTDGEDQFRTWLAVRNRDDGNVILLDYCDWRVRYFSNLFYDDMNPDASEVQKVLPGAEITQQGAGKGGRRPVLGGEVANAVAARPVWTTWRRRRQ